jgi:hypothetical protein
VFQSERLVQEVDCYIVFDFLTERILECLKIQIIGTSGMVQRTFTINVRASWHP